MSDTTETDLADELADDASAQPAQQQRSFRCSLDDNNDEDDDDDAVDYMPRILIVSQVPDAVFDEQQAQVINACYVFGQTSICP